MTENDGSTVHIREGSRSCSEKAVEESLSSIKKNVKQFDILLFALDSSLFRGHIVSARAARLPENLSVLLSPDEDYS